MPVFSVLSVASVVKKAEEDLHHRGPRGHEEVVLRQEVRSV